MTTLPGVVLLAGAMTSLVVLRCSRARLLQILGFGTFLFFSLASKPSGEFFWADLSLVPFLLLTAGVIGSIRRRSVLAGALVLALFIPAASRSFAVRDNYHALDWGAPAAVEVEQYRNSQRFLFLGFRDRDHVALYRFGPFVLPAARRYEEDLRAYRDHLLDPERARSRASAFLGLPEVQPERLETERRWVNDELSRFAAG
jgi:hypothetical protein